MIKQFTIISSSEMEILGGKLAKVIKDGFVIYLEGELGAGKTTFVRGFLQELGYQDYVRSPSFNLFELYELQDKVICHLDLYRLKDPNELINIGIRDYFNEKTICLIEWPKKGEGFLPQADISCNFSLVDDPSVRLVEIKAVSGVAI